MLSIPEKLFQRASALGLECRSDHQHHIIRPQLPAATWYLTYQKGRWVLIVNGTAQIHFSYSEVMTFLDRVEPTLASPGLPPVNTRWVTVD